jgi:hypothetical protein
MASILQLLAQKMGKSSDEVLEALGKKAATTGDEVSEAATMANLQREAADAVQPIGSGKNLDALQSASDDIATATKTAELQKGALNAPYVDAERNINNANLGLSYDDAPAAQYKTPAPDGIKTSQAAPASLADTASKLQGSVNIDRIDPRLKGVIAAMGLGGLGYGMMGGDEPPQGPIRPADVAAKEQSPELAIASPQPKSPAVPSKVSVSPDDLSKIAPVENAEAPTEEQEVDYSSLMREAQQASGQNQFYNHLLRAGNQAGAAIAGLGAGAQVKADYSGVDALDKTADSPVTNIKGLMETKTTEQKLKAAQDELKDDAKMRDPNSEVSKLTAELAVKAGLIKPGQSMSAQALKNSGVNIGNLLSTIEAGKARKEAAALQREATASAKATIQEDKKTAAQKILDDKRKLVLEEVEDRKQNIKDNIELVRKMVKDKGTAETFGSHNEDLNRRIDTIAVDMAKLTDPKSVARPAEVEMFKKGLFGGGAAGMNLTNQSALDILKNFESEVESRADHAYKVRGFDSPNQDGTPLTTPSTGKTIAKKQYSPSRNQTKVIYSDGTEEIVDGKQ